MGSQRIRPHSQPAHTLSRLHQTRVLPVLTLSMSLSALLPPTPKKQKTTQEASLFKAWTEVEEAKAAAEAAAAVVEEEEEQEVGPTLPGQALINKAKANMGGFLLPGEGDRCVRVYVCVP